jgi:hypothetical protein
MECPRQGALRKAPQPPCRIAIHWIRRLANFALMVCLMAVVRVLPATGREIVIQHFDERVVIDADGSTEVTETIEAEFIGSN